MDKFVNFAGKVSRGLTFPSAFFMGLMGLVILADITKRTIMGKSLLGAYEEAEMLLVLVVFLALANAQRAGSHIKVSALIERLSPHKQQVIDCVNLGILFVFTVIMFWQGVAGFWDSFITLEWRFGFIPFPVYPSKFFVPLGMGALAMQFLADFLVACRTLRQA